jgi:hypothetical protein
MEYGLKHDACLYLERDKERERERYYNYNKERMKLSPFKFGGEFWKI